MKQVLSIVPALLIICVLITGFSFPSEELPATDPVLVALDPQSPMGGISYSPFEGVLISYSPFEGGQGDVKAIKSIKIGLLIQTPASVEAKNGAEIAIDEANRKGGFKGREFELVIKSMEGPWGTGSKQAVDMIFEDEVMAIVGSHDGRNAHLVEQATTKAHITFLSAWAGDPTLSQAFTPWFFSCVPNDNQQAEILVEELYVKEKFSRIAVITDDDYDAASAFKSFVRKSAEAGYDAPFILRTDISESDYSQLAGKIGTMKAECLLLFTARATADNIINELKESKVLLQLYGPLYLLSTPSPYESYPGFLANLLLLSSGDWFHTEKSVFARNYHSKFGKYPDAPAAYTFDALTVIINAVIAAGADSEKVQKMLMQTNHTGATGLIKFDAKGNRILPVKAK